MTLMCLTPAVRWTAILSHNNQLKHLHSLPNSIKALKSSPALPWTLKTTLLTTLTCKRVRLASALFNMSCSPPYLGSCPRFEITSCLAVSIACCITKLTVQVILWMWTQSLSLQRSLITLLGSKSRQAIKIHQKG